jgi:hypothetical protein
MRIVLTGASGMIGSQLAARLAARGDEVVALGRSTGWDPASGPAPGAVLAGADAVVHLAGENIAQRWTAGAKMRIRESRGTGTSNLVAGIAAADPRPRVLVCANAVGFYGDRGDERLTEDSGAGGDWLAGVCIEWEQEALRAGAHGVRVCVLRSGVVLDRRGGALAKMLPAFAAGIGGPVAGDASSCPGSTSRTSSRSTWRRSTTSAIRAVQRGRSACGAQRRVLARPRGRPPPPLVRARSGARAARALRRDGGDHHRQPERRSGARH